jgi:hypothetical protein
MRNPGYTVFMGILAILVVGASIGIFIQVSTSAADQFNPTAEQLATDLNGQVVGLPYGQAWPFDPTQKVQVKIIGKKEVVKLGEMYIVIFANVQAQADVTPVKNKDEKEVPKEAPKLPKKVALNGVLKMHYEQVAGQWYLVFLEGVGMKAMPLSN